jgi:hypothetical protein
MNSSNAATANDLPSHHRLYGDVCCVWQIAPEYKLNVTRDAKPKSFQAVDNVNAFISAARSMGVNQVRCVLCPLLSLPFPTPALYCAALPLTFEYAVCAVCSNRMICCCAKTTSKIVFAQQFAINAHLCSCVPLFVLLMVIDWW